jgi:hypothetical protein
MDRFGDSFIAMYGPVGITNYIHIWIAGHVRFFLREYGNVYRLAQHGFEGKMTTVRSYRRRRTNQGSVMSLPEAMKKHILKGFAWAIESFAGGESSGYVEARMLEGRQILLSRRAAEYRRQKDEKRLAAREIARAAAVPVEDQVLVNGGEEKQQENDSDGEDELLDFRAEDEDLSGLEALLGFRIPDHDEYIGFK